MFDMSADKSSLFIQKHPAQDTAQFYEVCEPDAYRPVVVLTCNFSRAHLTQKIRDLESRLRTVAETRSSAAIASTSNAVSPQAQNVRPELGVQERRDVDPPNQETSSESSDEESSLDRRAANLFRDESASGFGYFGKTIEPP